MKKKIRNILLSGIVAFGLGSCNDFFDILPLNDIVLEGFYTEENDISSVLNSCYAGLESADCINRMAVWGEIRSDNISPGSNVPNDETQILKENIMQTTKYASWASFYSVINRCNTVMYYAPLVNEKDPNYTDSEMKANIAEAKAIRALCYFYLVRAFRDVPFVTEPSIDDTQDFAVPASSFGDILNYLIEDLEVIKNDAVRRYSDKMDNTTRFTRFGIYALLADLYLWNDDYESCVRYCDLLIDYKQQLYLEEIALMGNNTDIELYKGYPLISEHSSGSTKSGNASTKIFGEKNSFESIFELNFVQNQSVSNSFVSNYYGSSSNLIGYFSATAFLAENVATSANKLFKNTDCRYLEFMEKSSTMYSIAKYTRTMVSFDTPLASSTTSPAVSASKRPSAFANWIIYRFTDILLMKAEAQIQLGKTNINDTVSVTETMKPYMRSAFNLVSAVYNRANNLTNLSTDTLKYSDHSATVSTMESLVLNERQRELMFEGKRWFDLVRMARREGNNEKLINHVISKHKSNTGAIRIRMKTTDGLYFPYSENELKLNKHLKQNPVYITDESTNLSE